MKRLIIGAAIMAATLCSTSCRFVTIDRSKFDNESISMAERTS